MTGLMGVLITGIAAIAIGGILATDPTNTLKYAGVAAILFGIAILAAGVVGVAKGG